MQAVLSNRIDKLKEILSVKNVDTCDENGLTLLMWAVQKGNREVCELLVRNKATVDKQMKKNGSALLIAAREGHVDICRLLIENGATVDME